MIRMENEAGQINPVMEWAPGAGQDQAATLTVGRGC